jgi:hypothetical protein
MFSEIKIYDPGLKKKGHIEVYINGVRKRLYSGEEIGVDCSPTSRNLRKAKEQKNFTGLLLS